ncbi:MAG: hypothetical protein ACP5JW_08220, partial [Candidatus Bathyarchaeia archaeon]
LIYLEKSALKHSIFPVKFEEAVFYALLDRVQKLHEALITDEKPKPDAQHWECRFCEFKGECDGNTGDSESSHNQNVGGGRGYPLCLCLSVNGGEGL